MQLSKLTGFQKSAVLLIALGADLSAGVLKEGFNDSEIEQLTGEVSNMLKIPVEVKNSVMDEFIEIKRAREYLLQGGFNYAREMLEKALGASKASEILGRLISDKKAIPFSALRKTEPKHLLSFIQEEHPQTIALILAHLTPEQAATILASLSSDLQSEISRRIALIDRFTPDIIKGVEELLERKLSSVMQQEQSVVGGIQSLVDILNRVGRSTEKSVLEGLEREDPVLAEEVKRRMFIFEDIFMLPDNFIQRLLKDVNTKDLALAMRGSNEDVCGRIFRNMSKRAADMLMEDIDLMGPVRLREVEQAQQRIVAVIRKLDESGEIIISRGGEDVIIG